MGLTFRRYSGNILAIVLVQLILVSAVWASPQKVYFAGFAFLSKDSDIQHEYFFSNEIWNLKSADDRHVVDVVLEQKLQKFSNPNIEVAIKELGDHESADSLSLALALDWEDVCREKLAPELYKIVLNLHGQILVFDIDSKQIVATYPFGVRINDTSKTWPDDAHIKRLFERLYFENIGNVSFFDEFVKKLQKIKIDETFNHLIKVTEVVIGEKSFKYMPDNVKSHPAAYKTFVAQQFSSFLSANQGVAVLPYTGGHAISNKMPLRFKNGKLLNLTIPEEDIPIKITIRGFKKVQLDKNHTGAAWAYGSFIKLTVFSPKPDHKPVIDAKFKNAAVKIIPSTQTTVGIESDWPAFEESLLSLFNQLTKQISKRSPSWISKKTKDKSAKSQLKKLEELLQRI